MFELLKDSNTQLAHNVVLMPIYVIWTLWMLGERCLTSCASWLSSLLYSRGISFFKLKFAVVFQVKNYKKFEFESNIAIYHIYIKFEINNYHFMLRWEYLE